jgi:hypothetical protein
MRTDTLKLATIEEVKKALRKGKKFYTSSDFPFIQMDGFYLTYRAKIMNMYLRKRGYLMIKAKEIGLSKSNEKHSIRANRNIWISVTNYINYKRQNYDKN